MSKKFKGKLGKPIFVQPPGLLELMTSPEKALTAHSNAIEQARAEKIRLLFDHYGVGQGDFYTLAMSMALDLVPGLQLATETTRSGAPEKWNAIASGYLVVELERLQEQNKKLSVKSAAAILAKRMPWKDLVRGDNVAETLRQQYTVMKKDKWATVFRDAFRTHALEDSIAEWDAAVLDLRP
ncbi:hypothetical protein [Ralstonia sp. UBA689]|uniref:hypothetical protein n=1 Tax=Ralstonia sp. UBA689 TaxID=1947373 RepID=UPI0025FBCF05|nr:hypothetical protein [Ralstonia sp. UBA689]